MSNLAEAFIATLPAAPGRALDKAEPHSVEVDCVPDEAWDRTVGEFADTNHEQTACYAANHWKGRDSHLLLSRAGVPVAGARVALVKLPLTGRGLAFLRFGPFWRRRDTQADPEIYEAMIDALHREYCMRRGYCLTILPRPHPQYHALECSLLRQRGFVQRREPADAERYLVDTSLDDDAQRASLAQKWRYNLRHALGNPIDVRLTESPDYIQAFQTLYLAMKERKHFSSTTPVHLTGELMSRLPERLKPKLVVATHGGRLVAGATIGLFGDTAYYMFGATAPEALPLKAGYALHWWIFRWLHEQKIGWYDLGGAAHEPGLRQFKKGFVGKAGRTVVMEGEHDKWATSLGRLSADAIFGLRRIRQGIRRHTGSGGTGNTSS